MAEHPYLVRVDPELWRQAKAKAKAEKLSLKALWEQLLRSYVGEEGWTLRNCILIDCHQEQENSLPMSPANQLPDEDPLF